MVEFIDSMAPALAANGLTLALIYAGWLIVRWLGVDEFERLEMNGSPVRDTVLGASIVVFVVGVMVVGVLF